MVKRKVLTQSLTYPYVQSNIQRIKKFYKVLGSVHLSKPQDERGVG